MKSLTILAATVLFLASCKTSQTSATTKDFASATKRNSSNNRHIAVEGTKLWHLELGTNFVYQGSCVAGLEVSRATCTRDKVVLKQKDFRNAFHEAVQANNKSFLKVHRDTQVEGFELMGDIYLDAAHWVVLPEDERRQAITAYFENQSEKLGKVPASIIAVTQLLVQVSEPSSVEKGAKELKQTTLAWKEATINMSDSEIEADALKMVEGVLSGVADNVVETDFRVIDSPQEFIVVGKKYAAAMSELLPEIFSIALISAKSNPLP